MDEFPSNSRRPASPIDKTSPAVEEPELKLDKVISGKIIKRKKPLGRRFMDTFFSGDASGVIPYLFRDVLIPALQDMATDMVKQGIERAVYGEVRTTHRSGYRGSSTLPRTHVSYDRPSSVVGRAPSSYPVRRPATQPSAFNIGEVILDSLINAQVVADELEKTIMKYGAATVANLNDLTGETSAYTDHKYGWTDLSAMTIKHIREGYLLILPDPEDLR